MVQAAPSGRPKEADIMSIRRASIGLGVIALAIAGFVHPAGAASPRTETTVHDFHTFDVIDGATAALTRTANGLSATFRTTLPAGHAETMWWVIFNSPEGCTDGCGDDEIFAVFGGGPNPAGVSILNADGRVAPASGPTTFAAHLTVGSDGPGEVLLPGGITNPLGALVLLVIDEHGPAASDQQTRWLQTHALTLEGACSSQTPEDPFGDCFDTQIAIFPAS
jgi:hypothetical protein